MAVKYHVSQGAKTSGQLVRCRAGVNSCPRGGVEDHKFFNSIEEAREFSELSLAREFGGGLSTAQEERLSVLEAVSASNAPREPKVMMSDGVIRFFRGAGLGDIAEASEKLENIFKEARVSGDNVVDGRVEVALSDRYNNYFGTPVIAEDLVNSGYVYALKNNDDFYVKYRSSVLENVVMTASTDVGFDPGQERDGEVIDSFFSERAQAF